MYQKARSLSLAIFNLTHTFPKEEKYALTDQIRRSSRSVGAQIAEAWAKRRYEKHFISKLTDADGEQQETQHWLEVAQECRYIDLQICKIHVSHCEEIGRMLGSMMNKSSQFCRPNQLRESDPIYFIQSTNDENNLQN